MTGLQAVTTTLARAVPASKKFSGSGLTARLVLDDETKADAYGLRHRSYLSGGYIDPQPGGLFSGADDLRPNNRSIMIYKHRRPVASVRLCTLDRRASENDRADAERLGGPLTLGALYYRAALREEQKFARFGLAPDYDVYRRQAGTFLPRLSAFLPG
jgi:hypothetical protein